MDGSKRTKDEARDEAVKQAGDALKQTEKSLEELADKILRQGMLPKDAIGLDDVAMEGIYAQAYRLYNTGKYLEASQLFRILTMLNTTEPKYTLGLAACFHMVKEYKNAAQTYTMCGILDPENPIPHYHASDCYLNMGDKLSALISLELAVKRAGEKPEYAKLKDRALLSIEALKKELGQKKE
jgi:type III secretion system low calcium response chaperone LcrH/SycD